MYRPGLTELELAELAAACLTPEDVEPDPVEIWPDVFPVYLLFSSMSTQWRAGMGSPTGLDYNVLYHKMDRMNLPADDYERMETDIQIMEAAALEVMNRKSES